MIIVFALVIGIFSPVLVHAGNLTLPVDVDPVDVNNSWFDHNSTAASFLRYDGDTTDNYDGHNGTDFATSTGVDVVAPADGEVKEVYWDNCGGWQMHIWHASIGLSTLYSHLGTTTSATTTDTVSRGEHIADVDVTGSCTSGAHLHFGVTDGEDRTTSNRIDPFGWSGGGSDPWTYDLGYLWSTNPPEFSFYWHEGFEPYSTGNLPSQGGWHSDTGLGGSFQVINNNTYEGSKSAGNGGENRDAFIDFTLPIETFTNPIYFSVAHKTTDAAPSSANIVLRIGNTRTSSNLPPIRVCELQMGDSRELIFNSSGTSTLVNLGNATQNLYSIYETELDPTYPGYCRMRVDGGAWSIAMPISTSSNNTLSSTTRTIYFKGRSSNDNGYWDDLNIHTQW